MQRRGSPLVFQVVRFLTQEAPRISSWRCFRPAGSETTEQQGLQPAPGPYRAHLAPKSELRLSLAFSLTKQALPLPVFNIKVFPHIRRKYCWSLFLSLPHLNISFSYFNFHLLILTGSDGFEADVFPFQTERTEVFELRIDIV